MKKNLKRIVSIMFTCMVALLSMHTVLASESDLPSMNNGGTPDEVQNVATHVLGYIQLAGYAMAIGMLLYLGIKYMMAPANEKANLKNSSIKYVAGAIIIGGATALLTILSGFASGIVD